MDAYTPSARPRSRKAHIGLSAREYTKVAGTIASVRQNRPSHQDQHGSEPSFIAETSFVKAPLNSRVCSVSKGKAKQHDTLDRVPLDVQQALVLEDLLYVLMGIEGTYITYSPDYSPEDDDPLQGIKFVATASLDKSLRDLVERILPLGTYYTSISSFIELRSHLDLGLVNHALCAAVRDMLKDYQTLLSQLEHAFNTSPTFSLQKLWFYVHPTVHTLSLIYNLVLELASYSAPGGLDEDEESDEDVFGEDEEDEEERARNEALGLGGAQLKALQSEFEGGKKSRRKTGGGGGPSGVGASDESSDDIPVKGGEVLAVIYERMQHHSGDPTAREVYGTLLRKAGKPYVEMVRGWVASGRLVDPYEEFLVKERRDVDRKMLESDYVDEYWEGRYTLRDGSTHSSKKGHQVGVPPPRSLGGRLPGGACIPPLLEGWKHKILLAGKYLNVIRECGIELSGMNHPEQAQDEELFMDDEKFYAFLELAYTLANTRLLSLLLKDQQLIPRLRSLKRYFFLSQSTWLSAWLEAGSAEWRKPAGSGGDRKKEAVNLSRLQHLLDLAVGADGPTVGVPQGSVGVTPSTSTASAMSAGAAGGGDGLWKEEIRVGLSDTGLYAFLLQVVSVTGVGDGPGGGLGGLDEGAGGSASAKRKEEKRKDGRGSEKEKEEKKSLNAIEALTLDYIVPFPLSLVISRKTILRYQLIFRFLLHLKYAEMGLAAMWADQKTFMPWRTRKSTVVRRSLAPPPPPLAANGRPASAASNPKNRTRSLSRARATPTPTAGGPRPMSRATSTSTLHSDPGPEMVVDNDGDEFERWRRRVWLLRARMLGFVQQILAFATFEVLEPNWRRLEGKLVGSGSGAGGAGGGVAGSESVGGGLGAAGTGAGSVRGGGVTTVDQLLRDHVDFLDTVLKECMLTSSKLLQAYSRLIVTCQTFAMYTSMFTKHAESAVEDWEAEVKGNDPTGESKSKRWDTLLKFEKNFNHWFNIFINCVQFFASSENVSLLPLVVRLNSIKQTTVPSGGGGVV